MSKVVDRFEGQWISKIPTRYKEDESDYYDDNPNTLLRKSVNINKSQNKYYLFVGCLGYYIAYINGKRVGDYELNSDWTQYDKTIYYDSYDVSDLIVDGENIISFELGNGMYNPSPLRLFGKYNLREQLRVVGEPTLISNLYEGDKCIEFTDSSWKVGEGPLLFNNLYLGEKYDGRLVEKNWTLQSFDDSNWISATIDTSKKGRLVKSEIPKVRKKKVLTPYSIKKNNKGNLIVDFRETLSGMINISFNGYEGQSVNIIYAEDINKDDTVDCYSSVVGHAGTVLGKANFKFDGGPGSPEVAIQKDEIISVNGENHYENKFTYHSFRYVEIIGLKEEDLIKFEAIYVYTDVDIVGNIKTSSLWMNTLYELAEVTKLNNIHSVFEDCARERLGYGGDIVALATSNLFMFDLNKMYEKTVVDFRQDQTNNGGIPETAPYMGIQTNGTDKGEGPLLWQLVYPYIVYKCYQYYGDIDLVETEYEFLRKQMKYLIAIGIENLQDKCLGDHGSADTERDFRVGTPDKKFLAYCTYVLFLKYNIYLAKLVDDYIYEEYEEELKKSKVIIDRKFKNEDGTYGDKTQSSYAFAIFAEITEEPKILCEKFVDKIIEDKIHLRSGIFGLMMTYEVLNKYGYDSIIEQWLLRDDNPSIGFMINYGRTALSEQFNMKECSHNHAMLSSYAQWFYQGLGGIRVDDDAERSNKITISPYFSDRINDFECKFKTYSGDIISSWKRTGDQIIWNFNIPEEIKEYKVCIPKQYIIIETNHNDNSKVGDKFYMILEKSY